MNWRSKRWVAAVSSISLWLLWPVVVSALQLPPEIQADRYLLEAEKSIQEQDYAGAKESMDRILALRTEHGLEIPEQFFVRYAEVMERLGFYDAAEEYATEYLMLAGRDGEYYREALELLIVAEEGKAVAAKAEAALPGMEFVRVPTGEFVMGSDSAGSRGDEGPPTRVRLSEGYYIGRHEVTQAQWEVVMGSNPSYFNECGRDCPVENVSWEDVQEFILRLNARPGGERYRLPTEAEWEYAARAGTSGDRYSDDLGMIAWCGGTSAQGTHPVGGKAPNAWGLHDMLGNVAEWVQDYWSGSGGYPGGSVTDPRGPSTGSARIHRGGSWSSFGGDCRTPGRSYGYPGYRYPYLGFRLVRTK